MTHFSSMCFSYPLNTQVQLYDGHGNFFDDSEFNIVRSHHIQSLILKVGDSVHEQSNNNGP